MTRPVSQGDVFWLDLGRPHASEPGGRRPCLILQSDLYNRTRLQTVVVCLITSNLDRAAMPGNVALRQGEANLPRRSVANVIQIYTVDRSDLGDRLGTLARSRVREILDGVRLLTEPIENEPT
ncbi:MAG: type II toxin-antitoxin system PemK/MazF family toxin [Myxococcales bacterium]|nr:type II toxin-antitoxin system PemK/MazF family toxin [Myxococcales bacterium]